MRKDMAKVVTERPRSGRRLKQPKGYKKETQNLEDSPKREKIRVKWRKGFSGKEFTDVLGPLVGYVNSIVGRKFDEVFSEISQVLKPNSTQGSHILDHLWQLLKTKVIKDGNKILNCDGTPIYSDRYWNIAYVDPEDGIIKKFPKRKWKKEKVVPNTVWIDEFHCYRILNGVWYYVTFEKYNHLKQDIIFNKCFRDNREAFYAHGKSLVAVKKRQLNKKEIKKANLWQVLSKRITA